MPAGDEGIGLLQVLSHLGDAAGLARKVARHLDSAAGEFGLRGFEAAHIIGLPAVQGQGHFFEGGNGGIGIHLQFGVSVFCIFIDGFVHRNTSRVPHHSLPEALPP